ncbi:DUF4360 domain-containing protein [Actinomadura soli]|uniref:DUF4360 domain-containing protein n=1 Tax=Actinomadura soli TaxID=2508997 RepID=A0A5C4JAJ1_9ACTN|nr:DUF4360 domain-containing protein [Actinomadura soli]TMQ95967.1 DUF4360 domain-containing protein [Actinomadura soli]
MPGPHRLGGRLAGEGDLQGRLRRIPGAGPFAHLETGANAALKVGHYVQGQSWGGVVTHNLNGPYDEIWRFTHRPPADELVYKPCGEDRNVVLVTSLRVDRGTSDPSKTSYIAMDAVGEGVWTTYHLTWKPCP